jgi:hypothetical protein
MTRLVEDQTADAVAAIDRGPAEQGGRPRRNDRLEGDSGPETHRGPLIDQEPDRALALLPKELDVRLAGPRGDPPVHVAGVVAGLIDA